MPVVAEPVNARTVEHLQSVLHHMRFHHWQGSARSVGHGVHREIERGMCRNEGTHKNVRVTKKRLRIHRELMADVQGGCGDTIESGMRLFDHRRARPAARSDCVSQAGRQERETAGGKARAFPVDLQSESPLQDVDEALKRSGTEAPRGLELRGVLRERGAYCKTSVDNGRGVLHSRQWRAYEAIRRENSVVTPYNAACVAH
jgi:hypothetical protein